jgi:succinyl-diaminopimelate desuccinylase
MRANDQVPDFCLVGEPTCQVKLGDMVKIGRRGSVNMKVEVHGTQGHVAYPHRADNPVHRLIRALDSLTGAPVDAGTDWFEPSTLQVTSIDVANDATNVIPASARAALNIRFNDAHSGASLTAWVRATLSRYADRFDLEASISGESFVTKPGPLVDILTGAITGATGIEPKLDTGGGTSDARFIANYCPVAEFGLVGATMHQADERVPVSELADLARIYRDVITAFLA